MLRLRLDDVTGAIIWRSTHPLLFYRVNHWTAAIEAVQFVCSHCQSPLSCPCPDSGQSWEEKARQIGGSAHSSKCNEKRRRHGETTNQGDAAAKHIISVQRAHGHKPPPMPTNTGKLRESYPIPPFSVVRMDLDDFQRRNAQVRLRFDARI